MTLMIISFHLITDRSVVCTIPVTESLDQALRHQEHKRRFSSGDSWSSTESQFVRDLRRYHKNEGRDTSKEHLHEDHVPQLQ